MPVFSLGIDIQLSRLVLEIQTIFTSNLSFLTLMKWPRLPKLVFFVIWSEKIKIRQFSVLCKCQHFVFKKPQCYETFFVVIKNPFQKIYWVYLQAFSLRCGYYQQPQKETLKALHSGRLLPGSVCTTLHFSILLFT